MNVFLFNHSGAVTLDTVYSVLNRTRSIETWVSPFPGTAIILSRLTLTEMTAVLQSHFPGVWFILITATQQNTNGWLPNRFWEYINDPQGSAHKRLLADFLKPTAGTAPTQTTLGDLMRPKAALPRPMSDLAKPESDFPILGKLLKDKKP